MGKEKHSRGQRNLYEKMLRRAVESRYPNRSSSEITDLMDLLHWAYKKMFNGGKSTKDMTKEEFLNFHMQVEPEVIEEFGVSWDDNDKFPFHEQPKQ